MRMPELTKEFLNSIFEFKEGYLCWKVARPGGIIAGDRAGTSQDNWYIAVGFFGHRDRAHRIVWMMNHGPIPEGYTIDHRDNDPSNNRIDNLRLATNSQNTSNRRKVYGVNKSGYKGVFYVGRAEKWRVQITINGKCNSLGYFDTAEQGHEAYKQAANELHGEFANY